MATQRASRKASRMASQKISQNVESLNNIGKKLRRPTMTNGTVSFASTSRDVEDFEEDDVKEIEETPEEIQTEVKEKLINLLRVLKFLYDLGVSNGNR